MFGSLWDVQVGAGPREDLSVVSIEGEPALEDIERLFLPGLDVKGRPAPGGDDCLDQEIGSTRVVARRQIADCLSNWHSGDPPESTIRSGPVYNCVEPGRCGGLRWGD